MTGIQLLVLNYRHSALVLNHWTATTVIQPVVLNYSNTAGQPCYHSHAPICTASLYNSSLQHPVRHPTTTPCCTLSRNADIDARCPGAPGRCQIVAFPLARRHPRTRLLGKGYPPAADAGVLADSPCLAVVGLATAALMTSQQGTAKIIRFTCNCNFSSVCYLRV